MPRLSDPIRLCPYLTAVLAVLAAVVMASTPAPVLAAPGDTVSQATGPATPLSATESEADLRATVERYARAWYEGNASQMALCLHPEFIQRTVRHAPRKPDAIESFSGLAMLDRTDRGLGRSTAPLARKSTLHDLLIRDGVATVRLQLADRSEHLQLVRWNNRWRVLNSLVEVTDAGTP